MTTISTSGIMCGACGFRATDRAGQVSLYLSQGAANAQVWKCGRCGTYIQDANYDDPAVRGHFDVASYTAPGEEARWRRLRTGFFEYIIDLAERHLERPLAGLRSLDVGIAYGIMLDLLREGQVDAEGVEIVAALRNTVRSRGFVVHERIDDASVHAYDLVTAIDSFYYVNDPEHALRTIRALLKPCGIFILRLANRTWYFDLTRRLGRRIPAKRFGDLKYFYSDRGARLLLARTGFRIERVYWADRRRRDPRLAESIFYTLSPIMNHLLPVKISPGMIIVARPTDDPVNTE